MRRSDVEKARWGEGDEERACTARSVVGFVEMSAGHSFGYRVHVAGPRSMTASRQASSPLGIR